MQPQHPPPPPPPPLPQPPQSNYPPSNNIEEGGNPEDQQQQSTGLIFCLSITHNLTQVCLGGVVVSALFIPNILDPIFSTLVQHIVLCTVGYFILMTQAIIAFSPFGWANHLKYENRKLIHAIMQILGSILALAGCAIQITETSLNLESNHGICGLVAMLMTVISLIGGILNLILPQKMNNKLMKILHSLVGTVTIFLAFIALIFAFHVYYRDVAADVNANLSISLAVFALLGTLLIACVKNAKRILDK